MITQAKQQQLQAWMTKLGIKEDDLEEQFILASGRGGQKVNKTASCVRLTHQPSGISIKCSDTRSRETNRFYARRRLCEKLEEQILGEKSKQKQLAEKIRQQKKKRSKRAKAKILADKRHQSTVKQRRKPPSHDD